MSLIRGKYPRDVRAADYTVDTVSSQFRVSRVLQSSLVKLIRTSAVACNGSALFLFVVLRFLTSRGAAGTL